MPRSECGRPCGRPSRSPFTGLTPTTSLLPRHPAGTLILQGADMLTAPAQQQLFAWLDSDARSTRVLTTTPSPLFPLVESGAFLAALYHRLNMLLLLV